MIVLTGVPPDARPSVGALPSARAHSPVNVGAAFCGLVHRRTRSLREALTPIIQATGEAERALLELNAASTVDGTLAGVRRLRNPCQGLAGDRSNLPSRPQSELWPADRIVDWSIELDDLVALNELRSALTVAFEELPDRPQKLVRTRPASSCASVSQSSWPAQRQASRCPLKGRRDPA